MKNNFQRDTAMRFGRELGSLAGEQNRGGVGSFEQRKDAFGRRQTTTTRDYTRVFVYRRGAESACACAEKETCAGRGRLFL